MKRVVLKGELTCYLVVQVRGNYLLEQREPLTGVALRPIEPNEHDSLTQAEYH